MNDMILFKNGNIVLLFEKTSSTLIFENAYDNLLLIKVIKKVPELDWHVGRMYNNVFMGLCTVISDDPNKLLKELL